jgi:hypothetical protein
MNRFIDCMFVVHIRTIDPYKLKYCKKNGGILI